MVWWKVAKLVGIDEVYASVSKTNKETKDRQVSWETDTIRQSGTEEERGKV